MDAGKGNDSIVTEWINEGIQLEKELFPEIYINNQ